MVGPVGDVVKPGGFVEVVSPGSDPQAQGDFLAVDVELGGQTIGIGEAVEALQPQDAVLIEAKGSWKAFGKQLRTSLGSAQGACGCLEPGRTG